MVLILIKKYTFLRLRGSPCCKIQRGLLAFKLAIRVELCYSWVWNDPHRFVGKNLSIEEAP